MKHPHWHQKHSDNVFINKLIYVVAVLYPLMTVPQIIKVYETQSAHDLSLVTWIMYVVLEMIFITYAIKNSLKPLIITGVLWLCVYGFMLAGILLYGR